VARSRTRARHKPQPEPTDDDGTITLSLSMSTILLIGGGLLALVLVLLLGVFIGQSSANPAPAVSQPPAGTNPIGALNPAPVGPTVAAVDALPTAAQPPPMTIDPSQAYTATIRTEKGNIVIHLRPDLAPNHVNNFIALARDGFYDGLWFHRVIPGFIAQAGDPKGDTTGGPGYSLEHEITDTPHTAGTVAMARLPDPFNPERDSSGSQFYIVLEDSAQATELDGQYTVFGEVVEGLAVAHGLTERAPGDSYPGDAIQTIEITEESATQ
jgi:peptidylprolyl isomerase